MQEQRKWPIGVLQATAVALAVAAALALWPRSAPRSLAPPVQHAAVVPDTMPVMRPARAAPITIAAPTETDLPLQVQLDHLLATREPEDALSAYQLVAHCAAFNTRHDRLIFDQGEVKHWKGDGVPGFRGMSTREKEHATRLCGGMTERERERRLDYLAIAVKAGVIGAAVAFANEGPFGDPSALTTRPDDPLVRDWKTAARNQLAVAAENGDLEVLMFLQGENFNGSALTDKNPALLYRYSLAQGLVFADVYGPNHTLATTYAADGAVMTSLAAGLSAEQVAAETAAARRIAINEKALREEALRTHPASSR